MTEFRLKKSEYIQHDKVRAAIGCKIDAPGLEDAVAGIYSFHFVFGFWFRFCFFVLHCCCCLLSIFLFDPYHPFFFKILFYLTIK